MTAVLEIRLFGGLEISQGGAPINKFVSSKAPALLAYLAVTGRAHQRDALAALLWGEMADAHAKNNLRQTLSNLRKLLELYLVITRDTIALETAVPLTLDVAQFETHLKASRASSQHRFEHLAQAAALYRGDFLAGFVVRDAPEFEEWLLAQRVRFRELALHTLHTLTQHHLECGEYGRAIDSATRLLALDAWREEAHCQLMLALARSGQRRAALSQYETCRLLLDKELGVPPSAETVALYERICAAADTPRHNLPAHPTPFVGREAELTQIAGLLQNPACRLLTLVGTGGMGKTRLALQAAARAHQHSLFLHGVFFVSLVGVDSETLLATAVATACDLHFSGSQNPTAQLFTFLRDQELLLVLDNFEHLLDETIWLVQLLQQAPGVKLLVTSREALNVQWEKSLPLDGLTLPAHSLANAAEATTYSALHLFALRASAVRPDFVLTEETIPCVSQICRLVEGMPLALELAAVTIRQYTCAELVSAITQNLDILATSYRDMPPRHRSLRAVFDNVWLLLMPSEQDHFSALSIFVGSFSQEAAAVVTSTPRPLLATLVDKSLLRELGNGRYQLHNVLRQYAAEKLAEAQQQTLPQQHTAFYANWLQRQEQSLFTPAEIDVFQAIQADLDNVRAAWFWALNHESLPLLQQSLKSLRTFYNVQSRFQEGAEWLAQTAVILKPLVAPTNPSALKLYAQVLARWASFAAWQGQNEQAEALFTEALQYARQVNDPQELGFLLLNKGYLTIVSGDYETAGKEYQESLEQYRHTEDAHGISDALSALGGWHNVTGDWASARLCLQESVTIARHIKDEHSLRSSLTNLGNVYYLLGDYEQAKSHYEEVLPLCQKVGDRAAEAIILCNLGALAEKAGNLSEAEQRLQSGIALFTEVNHPQAVVHASTMLASVFLEMRAFTRAQEILAQALHQAIENKYEYLIPVAIFEIGRLYQALQQPLEALPLLLWLVEQPAAQAENCLEAQALIEVLLEPLSPAQKTVVHTQGASLVVTAVLANLARNQNTAFFMPH
ncbi:MAG: tetratricopeptide repeat protein [Chloroflexi bacterium]|nr:tetratricopeptide repeat protein [Chloroflexota bacterium]